jgi:tetratricopeptide (TPR) repeat protein
MAFRKLGRFREGIKDCNRALQLEPDNGFFFYNRALAQYDLGLYEEVLTRGVAVCGLGF